MIYLYLGTALFFGAHFYSAFRSRAVGKDMQARMGYGPFMGLYSLLSLIGLGLIIFGYRIAPVTPDLYIGPVWTRQVSLVLMAVASVLIVAAYTPTGYLKRFVRHPMLTATGFWAIAHLIVGANWKGLVLFVPFLAFAVIDFFAASAREANEPAAPNMMGDIIAVVVGGGVFAALLLGGHEAIFGVSPR